MSRVAISIIAPAFVLTGIGLIPCGSSAASSVRTSAEMSNGLVTGIVETATEHGVIQMEYQTSAPRDRDREIPPVRDGLRLFLEEELLYIQEGGSGWQLIKRDQDGSTSQLSSGGPGYPSHFTCGHWDGDKREDYVTVYDQGSSQSNIFLTEADGGDYNWTFQPRVRFIDFGDWDGDGTDELLIVQDSGSGYEIILRDSENPGQSTQLATGGPGCPSQFACGDWDGDGRDDFAAVFNQGASQSNIFITEADGGDQYWTFMPRVRLLDFGDWDADAADELLIVQESGSGYEIILRDSETPNDTSLLASGGSGYPSHFACGDWDMDGRDDYVTVYNQGTTQSNIFVTEADGGGNYWTYQPRVHHIDFADWNGDGISVDYLESTTVTTDAHPIALLYQPPFADGINHNMGYTKYATGSDQGATHTNMLGIEASYAFSYSAGIPMLLSLKVGLTVKAGIEITYGGSQEILLMTGRITGPAYEPYVVIEWTSYDQYKYQVDGGPDDGKVFSIDVPNAVLPSCWELGYFNSHCGSGYQISSDHQIGDVATYTIEHSHDSWMEVPRGGFEDIGQGNIDLLLQIDEDLITQFTLHAGVDFTAGMEAGGFGFSTTLGVYWNTTHELRTGSITEFYSYCYGMPSDLYDAYRYAYRMYVYRDDVHEFPIIDFFVNPGTLGGGHYDTIPPQTTITSGPNGLIDYNQVSFTWTGSDNASPTQYLEYQYRLDEQSWSAWSGSTQQTISISSDGDHSFEVRARDLNDNIDPTPASRNFTVDVTSPTVQITSGPQGTIEYNDVTFTWMGQDPPFDAGTLTYSYKLEPIESWSAWGSGTSKTYNDLGGGSYTFWVRAKDQVDHISPSDQRSFVVEVPGCGPTLLTIPANGSTCVDAPVQLCWESLDCAVSYELQFGQDCGNGPIYTTTNACYSIVSLASGTTYYWRVRAQDDQDEWGEWTTCWSFEARPDPPAPPALVAPPCGSAVDSLTVSVVLDWQDVGTAARYHLQYGLEEGCTGGTIVYPTGSQYEVDLAGYVPGDIIYWKVLAEDGCSQLSPWSDCCSVGYGATAEAFIRADTDANGEVNISDPIYSLCYQFATCDPPPCLDAADTDDSGEVNISDPIYSLNYQFGEGQAPPAPFPGCGGDPTTSDILGCDSFAPCGSGPRTGGAPLPELARNGERIWLEIRNTHERDTVLGDVWIETPRTLVGAEFTVGYDPEVLTFARMDVGGLVGEDFDFFSCANDPGEGSLRAGAVMDFSLAEGLEPGRHHLATFEFTAAAEPVTTKTRLWLVDGLLVDETMQTVRTLGTPAVLALQQSPDEGNQDLPVAPGLRMPTLFRPGATIVLSLVEESDVCVEVFDIHGRIVRRLLDRQCGAGAQPTTWDGRDANGKKLGSGIYYVRASVKGHTEDRKILLAQ